MIYFYYGKDLIYLILSLYHGAKVSVQILYSCVLVSGGLFPLPLCGRTKNASQANSLPVVQMPARWRGFVLKVLWMYLKVERNMNLFMFTPQSKFHGWFANGKSCS